MRKYVRSVATILLIVVLAGGYYVHRMLPYAFQKVEQLRFVSDTVTISVESGWIDYPDEYLATLRTEYALDALIGNAVSDIERVAIVADWVHGLWKHDGRNTPAESHPLYILREVGKGERFRCVEYGIVISGCLQALGIPARTLGLKMPDVETRSSGAGHVVTEAYLADIDKWVMVDGQWNAIPFLRDVPLNAVELQAAIALKDRELTFPLLSRPQEIFYRAWITPYLYYFDASFDGVRVMLGPEGAKQPTVFQLKWPLQVDVFTHSVRDFYARPHD